MNAGLCFHLTGDAAWHTEMKKEERGKKRKQVKRDKHARRSVERLEEGVQMNSRAGLLTCLKTLVINTVLLPFEGTLGDYLSGGRERRKERRLRTEEVPPGG